MTLPDEEVLTFLDEHFVLGTKNIQKELHVGLSHGYSPKQTAVGTTNGAGGRNVQFLVMAPDETVLHVLPGFWHKEDLLAELRVRDLTELSAALERIRAMPGVSATETSLHLKSWKV